MSRGGIILDGDGGLAGNLWLGMMVGLGAPVEVGEKLPALLGLDSAVVSFDVVQRGDVAAVRVDISGTEQTSEMSLIGMLETIQALRAPVEVRTSAQAVLLARQSAEAVTAGIDLSRCRYAGDDVADTLIDVVGGVWLWRSLGAPRVFVEGPLAVGCSPPPAVAALLGDQATNRTAAAAGELTTPTGAALLQYCRTSHRPRGAAIAEVRVDAVFSDRGLVPPLRARLVLGVGDDEDLADTGLYQRR